MRQVQVSAFRADPVRESTGTDRGSDELTIAYQPATAPDPVSARPVLPRGPHELVPVRLPRRGFTSARLAGLLAATAVCVALATVVAAGILLFALVNYRG